MTHRQQSARAAMYVLIMTGIAALAVTVLGAQTSTSTHVARVEGTFQCRRITLSVNQATVGGSTSTTLFYLLRECAAGSTAADQTVASGTVSLPAGALKITKASYVLTATTPHGGVQLTFKPTNQQVNTFSGAWTTKTPTSSESTRQEQWFATAVVEGSVASWVLVAGDYPGQVSSDSTTIR